MSDDDIETILKAFPSIVEWRKVEEGIAVRPVNQPAPEKIVKMSVDFRDRIWSWFLEPKVFETSEEWKKLRKPVIMVMLEVAKIISQYGNPVQGEILLEALKTLQKGKKNACMGKKGESKKSEQSGEA